MNTSYEFNRVTFGLPVETFRISAHIALEERLPIVTEFVLRLLRVCGRVPLSELRDYFGFTDSEAVTLVESLCRQGLTEVMDDDVQLTAFAAERFDESGSDHPRFSKVELKQDTVTFDLISFTPLRAIRGPLPSDNIIKLDADDDVLGSSLERARNAYRKSYPEIASMREDLREKSYGVYSIEDVESKRRSYIPVPVTFSIDNEGQVVRNLDGAFEQIAPPELLQFVNEKITSLIPRTLSIGHPGLEEFIDAFNLQAMSRYLIGKKFDLNGFLTDVYLEQTVKFPRGATPIIGNLYLQGNRKRILRRLIDRREGKRRHGRLYSSLAWLAPDYSFWGRGDAFSSTVTALNSALRDSGSSDDLYVFVGAEDGSERSITNLFRVPGLRELHFYRSQGGNERIMSGRLELMLYPTAFVAALYHVSLPGNSGLWLPVGFISTIPRHLDTAHKLLRQSMGAGRYNGRAQFKQTDLRIAGQSFEEACPFLNYDSLSTKANQELLEEDYEEGDEP